MAQKLRVTLQNFANKLCPGKISVSEGNWEPPERSPENKLLMMINAQSVGDGLVLQIHTGADRVYTQSTRTTRRTEGRGILSNLTPQRS